MRFGQDANYWAVEGPLNYPKGRNQFSKIGSLTPSKNRFSLAISDCLWKLTHWELVPLGVIFRQKYL